MSSKNDHPLPHLVLLDAHNSLHRAYHAISTALKTKSGEDVSAVFGFTRTILRLLRELSPTHLAVCWDSKPQKRLVIDPSYKANRPETPESLRSQIALSREFLAAWRIFVVESAGYEADDLMATLALQAEKEGYLVTIVTTDKDMLQMAQGNVRVYLEHKKEMLDYQKVKDLFGFPPGNLIDYFALAGDSVDNIPGVKGIGEKTAKMLVARFGNIKALLNAAEDPTSDISSKVRSGLVSSTQRLLTNLELLKLKMDAPVRFNSQAMTVPEGPPGNEFQEFMMRLGFVSILKELQGAGKVNEKEIDFKSLGDSDSPKVFYDLKSKLHEHPEILGSIQGKVLDLKLLSWVANPSEESYELEWLLAKFGKSDPLDLAHALEEKLKEQGLWKIYEDIELPLTYALYEMERAGIAIDKDFLKDLSRRWGEELGFLRTQIIHGSGASDDLNLNSPKQLGFLLFEKLGLPRLKKTKTGYSTNEEVLIKLKSLHPIIPKLLEFREIAKLQTTYAEGLLASLNPQTGKIHATFHQEGTQTGRLSCSNPNLQNIPVRTERGLLIRKAFTPGEAGWLFLSLDYSQIDLRVFAHLSEDSNLIRFFQNGGDIHNETARALLGAGEGEVSGELRRAAKAINFGVLYGMGAWGLAETLGKTEGEAQNFIDLYYAKFPQVASWRQSQIDEARNAGCIRTLLGRIRYLEHIQSPRAHLREFAERTAINTPVQGTSADIIKLAMIQIADFLLEKKLKTRMLVQVHDEILFEGPQEEIKTYVRPLSHLMSRAIELRVPLVVHAKIGFNWKEMDVLSA